MKPFEIFVDYDATITDRDTFDVLVQHEAGEKKWGEFEAQLHGRAITLREVLAAEASLITCTLDEADAFLAHETRFDPTFAEFIEFCKARRMPVCILSSGVAPLIERALHRNGIDGVPVRANEIDPSPHGWIMHFRDRSDNGHDKAADVREAQARGATAVYIGDGYSDFDAAAAADVRFAKKGRALEPHLRERGLSYHAFSSFSEIVPLLTAALPAK